MTSITCCICGKPIEPGQDCEKSKSRTAGETYAHTKCLRNREDGRFLSKYIITKKCPICGKTFVRAPYHAYKVGTTLVRSYSCTLPGAKEKKRKEAESNG